MPHPTRQPVCQPVPHTCPFRSLASLTEAASSPIFSLTLPYHVKRCCVLVFIASPQITAPVLLGWLLLMKAVVRKQHVLARTQLLFVRRSVRHGLVAFEPRRRRHSVGDISLLAFVAWGSCPTRRLQRYRRRERRQETHAAHVLRDHRAPRAARLGSDDHQFVGLGSELEVVREELAPYPRCGGAVASAISRRLSSSASLSTHASNSSRSLVVTLGVPSRRRRAL